MKKIFLTISLFVSIVGSVIANVETTNKKDFFVENPNNEEAVSILNLKEWVLSNISQEITTSADKKSLKGNSIVWVGFCIQNNGTIRVFEINASDDLSKEFVLQKLDSYVFHTSKLDSECFYMKFVFQGEK